MAAMKYRPDIDGLRAVAVLMVLIFHFQLIPSAQGGFTGVDVFYVISGFLITAIVTRQLDSSSFSFKTFYLNRIRRLAPALFVTLAIVTLVGAIRLFPTEFVELSKEVFYSQTYVANIYFWRNTNYFGPVADTIPLLHTWSLAVEEQFYLFYPFAVFIMYRYFKRYFWLIIALTLVVSFGLNALFVGPQTVATFYLLPTRAWELLVGAFILFFETRRSRALNEILGGLGFCLILAGLFFYKSTIHFPGYFALLPVLGSAAIILSGRETVTAEVLTYRPIVYLGKISYPLYLVHWPIVVFAKDILGRNYSIGWNFALFAFSIALAALIYHVFEIPLRGRSVLPDERSLSRGYFFGLAITLSAVAVIVGTGGLPTRFPGNVIRLANFVNDQAPFSCEYSGNALQSNQDFCQIGASGVTPQWLVYGDSHAFVARSAFDEWLRQRGQAGLFIWRASCPPLEDIGLFGDRGYCLRFNQATISFLGSHPTIDKLFLVAAWREAAEGRLSISSDLPLSKDASVDLFKKQFLITIRDLHKMGKQVNVWEPIPGARENVPTALARAALEGRQANIAVSKHEYRSYYEFFFDALAKSRENIFRTFSPSAVLCGSGQCAVTINGNPCYFDSNHITLSSASFWANELASAYSE